MKMNPYQQKKNCNRCKALYEQWRAAKCRLGYKLQMFGFDEHGFTRARAARTMRSAYVQGTTSR